MRCTSCIKQWLCNGKTHHFNNNVYVDTVSCDTFLYVCIYKDRHTISIFTYHESQRLKIRVLFPIKKQSLHFTSFPIRYKHISGRLSVYLSSLAYIYNLSEGGTNVRRAKKKSIYIFLSNKALHFHHNYPGLF